MRTQVCIIGGGPAGLMLSQLLHLKGVHTVLLERRARDHVLGRIRAGVLEPGTVELLRQARLGDRMDRDGILHDGVFLACGNRRFRIDFRQRTGKRVMVWGQTEVTADLYRARDGWEAPTFHGVEAVDPQGIDTDSPFVTFVQNGDTRRIDCDFVAGCDGYHGISRKAIPERTRREYERTCPFGWLGVLSETPPVSDELVYCAHPRGFALCSMRNRHLSRYYVQCPLEARIENWSDDAFWDELRRRIPESAADTIVTGPSVEKSIAPLRGFFCEPMSWGRLFLVGDAAHIVPPTGAKGLNLAASDVHYLYHALLRHYRDGDSQGLKEYSSRALARVLKAMRFSWWFTNVMHLLPNRPEFDRRMQEAEIGFIESSSAAQTVLAENYVGLPY